MGDESSILATYSSGQYVFVRSKEFQDKLAHLGYFGIDIEHFRRKENSRRARPFEDFQFDSKSEPATLLTLHEAFYLAHTLGRLTILSEKLDRLSTKSCWRLFRRYYKGLNIHLDFGIEFGVYHYFRSRNWIVKTGENYGTNFLLYQASPSTEHSKYTVLIMPEDDVTYNWQSLLTFHRVAQSVGKELLLVYAENQSLVSEDPECIEKINITCRLFTSFPGTLDRQIDSRTRTK